VPSDPVPDASRDVVRRPHAAFKDLCADAADAEALASFWGAVLDRPSGVREDGVAYVEPGPGQPPAARLWLNPVTEACTDSRVHLALRLAAADPAALVALGATILTDPTGTSPWWVLADPDGNTFRAVGPHPDVAPVDRPSPFELVVDSLDPVAQARWWSAVVGGTVGTDVDRGVAWIDGAGGSPFRFWVFAATTLEKTVKNRWHWDLTLAEPAALLAAGASLLRAPGGDLPWWVLADPEGNEFCAHPEVSVP